MLPLGVAVEGDAVVQVNPDPLDPGPMGSRIAGSTGRGPRESACRLSAPRSRRARASNAMPAVARWRGRRFQNTTLPHGASALAVEATPLAVLANSIVSTAANIFRGCASCSDVAAGRVPILIELKARGGNAAKLAATVAAELETYEGPVGVMSFEPAVGRWFALRAPRFRRGLVISERASAFDRWRSIKLASPHFLAIDRAALLRGWVVKELGRRWLYSWTIGTPTERETAEIHVDALIWEGDGRPRI